MCSHESSVSSSASVRGGTAGVAAAYSCAEHFGGVVQALPSYMAVGRWLQHPGGRTDRQSALHQCPQMGTTFPNRRFGRFARSETTRPAQGARGAGGGTGDKNCHVSPLGFGPGLYHLVADKARRAPASAYFHPTYQSGDNTSYPCPSWPSVSYGSNMVREHRSRFRGKKNAIIGIYRHRPRWGQVVCFDEMGPLQTIPRGGKAWGKRAWLRPDRYRRNGTLQWFCAFSPHTGVAVGKGFPDKSAKSCTAFWLEHMLPFWPRGAIHLVMDNLSAHKKALRELPARIKRRIRPYYTPTNSSWLNLIESYFATLERTALHNTDYKTPGEIEQGLYRGMVYLNENPRAYKWKKV